MESNKNTLVYAQETRWKLLKANSRGQFSCKFAFVKFREYTIPPPPVVLCRKTSQPSFITNKFLDS